MNHANHECFFAHTERETERVFAQRERERERETAERETAERETAERDGREREIFVIFIVHCLFKDKNSYKVFNIF